MNSCEVKSFYKCRIPRPIWPCGNKVKVKSVVKPQRKCGIPRPIRPWGRPVSVSRQVSVRKVVEPIPEVSIIETSWGEGCAEVLHNIHYWLVWFVTGALEILDPFNILVSIYEDVMGEM